MLIGFSEIFEYLFQFIITYIFTSEGILDSNIHFLIEKLP